MTTAGQYFGDVLRRHPDRVVNVGSREQLRRYGRTQEHLTAHGLDAEGLRASVTHFLDSHVALRA